MKQSGSVMTYFSENQKTTGSPLKNENGGQGWIRTIEGVKPADLQSAPFGHFGTYPETWNIYDGTWSICKPEGASVRPPSQHHSSAACAAASLAIGIRNGEQLT